jgi:glutaconyl-CoA/methylmalonyl-CoA decarboxylase subunit gamma
MRRYHVEVSGRRHVIDVTELSAHEFTVTVGEQQFTVDLSAAEDVPETVISPDMAEVNNGGTPISAARFRPAAPDTLPSLVPAAPPPIAPSPLKAVRGAIAAPMPGTIVGVEVKPGDVVRAGQALLKLEAMKMINAIKSPRDGTIAAVPVQAGQNVTYGQVLVAFAEE